MQIGDHQGRVVQIQSRNPAKIVRRFAPCCGLAVEASPTPYRAVGRNAKTRIAGKPAMRAMAVAAGFEPAVAINYTSFRVMHLRPLGHATAE